MGKTLPRLLLMMLLGAAAGWLLAQMGDFGARDADVPHAGHLFVASIVGAVIGFVLEILRRGLK